jgi:hypothetical protein
VSTFTGERSEIDAYVDAVKAHLDDLAADEREEVLDDLRTHLAEVAAESDEPLARRLGPPDAYAAELRTSAGYGPAASRRRRSWRDLVEHPSLASVRAFVPELKPGWWVARAAAIVAALAVWNGATRADFPLPSLGGSPVLSVLVFAAIVPVSVVIGRRSRWGSLALSAAAVVMSLTALAQVELPHSTVSYVGPVSTSREMRAADGRPIYNIYPFAADGTPLENVLLYDQDGVPLDNLAPFTRGGIPVERRYQTDASGRPITNSFPQTVLLPGLGAAPRQDQRPPVTVMPPAAPTETTAPPSPTTVP